ncbi:MAG: phosphotransferase [Intrasporangiaceae bacterium]|nr:phosphotransferase [Intrasporangiaceae bacterium]
MRPIVSLLTGPRAAELIQGALTGQPGATVPGFEVMVHEVHDRIGSETSVTYHVTYGPPDHQVYEFLVATTADVDAGATVSVEGEQIRVWRHPADPRLPGLFGACTPEVLATWLPPGPDGTTEPDGTDVLVYRPLRRAVLRTTRGDQVYFTKVLRPKLGELLTRRHTLLAGLGPDVVAQPEPGVLITAAVPGVSLAVALSAWQLGQSETEPDPALAVTLLDRLPDEVLDLPTRPSWTDRIDFHGPMAAARVPDLAQEITELTADITELTAEFPVGPLVPTHGDFHEANIFCTDGRPARLIDVDTVGPGRREDDLACLTAHLAVLPALSPVHYPRGAEVAEKWGRFFEQMVHPGALRARVAGVLLSLVSGATPEQARARLSLAQDWAERARAVL